MKNKKPRVFTICDSKSGFTLLELMISITLIGIMVLIITGAMRLGFRSVDSGERKMEALERIRASLNIVDSQVRSEVPLTYDENGAKKYYFKGSGSSMQFSTNYSIWGGQKGYVVVAYRAETAPDRKQALYASENTIGFEGNRETKLFDNLDAIYFEYFYKGPTDPEGRWTEQWTDDNNIPEKIRLNLIDGTTKTSLILPMRARK